jgi:hypothetical protein
VLTRHTEGATTLAEDQVQRGDLNGDGKTDADDCEALKEHFRK